VLIVDRADSLGVNRFERLLDSPLGWVVPGGAPFRLGRKDGAQRTFAGSWLIWGVYGERMYERGRRRTIEDQAAV